MSRVGRGALLALVLVLLAPASASADLAAQARFHNDSARTHYAAGRYQAALEEFFAVQRIAPNPAMLFNIALCFEHLRRHEDTYFFYSEYLASSDSIDAEGDEDTERQREQARRVIERLDRTVARVRVITSPQGAEVFVSGREHGRYGVAPTVIAVRPGSHPITAALEGYRDANASVVAVAGQEAVVRLELTQILGGLLVRGPAEGTFTLRDDAGEAVAQGPLGERVSVPPARYVLEVASTGHRPWRSIASVEADSEAVVVAEPEPLPRPTGAITVTANHTGALVRLDDEPVGFAPLALPAVGLGEHRLEVSYSGQRPWAGRLEIHADERAWVTASLTPPASTERSPLTWVVGGFGIAALAAGGVLVAFAVDTHARHQAELNASPDPFTLNALRSEGVALNAAADVMLGVGVVGLGIGIALFFLTEDTEDEPSSAEISRDER